MDKRKHHASKQNSPNNQAQTMKRLPIQVRSPTRTEPQITACRRRGGSRFHSAEHADQFVSLSDFRGQPVVLAFYPADWSPSAATK